MIQEFVSRRVARLEGSLQVADQVACSALERAGIATPAEGYRRAGWSRLGDGIEQLHSWRENRDNLSQAAQQMRALADIIEARQPEVQKMVEGEPEVAGD